MKNIVKAIEKSGKSRYKIWQDTGISQVILHRIVKGGTASVETLDILCKYLGLELVPERQKKKGR
jgi:DNA-binding Xre family transcriptional regulator